MNTNRMHHNYKSLCMISPQSNIELTTDNYNPIPSEFPSLQRNLSLIFKVDPL